MIPKYSSSKKIFTTKTSYYGKPSAANVEDAAVNGATLQGGACDWNYTQALAETSDSRWPLGATATNATFIYDIDNTLPGGVWSGTDAVMPKWMTGVDDLKPGAAFGLAILCSAVNPKNLILAAGAAAGVAQLPGESTTEAVVALVVFVLVASVSVAFAVGYYLFGGESAHAKLDEFKAWLSFHNNAVMAVLFLVFGVVLISKGLNLLSA